MKTQHTTGPWEVISGNNYESRSPLIPTEYPHMFKADSADAGLSAAMNCPSIRDRA